MKAKRIAVGSLCFAAIFCVAGVALAEPNDLAALAANKGLTL